MEKIPYPRVPRTLSVVLGIMILNIIIFKSCEILQVELLMFLSFTALISGVSFYLINSYYFSEKLDIPFVSLFFLPIIFVFLLFNATKTQSKDVDILAFKVISKHELSIYFKDGSATYNGNLDFFENKVNYLHQSKEANLTCSATVYSKKVSESQPIEEYRFYILKCRPKIKDYSKRVGEKIDI